MISINYVLGLNKMTTVKEFEERKKEIAIKLNDALDAMLELKPNLASNIVADQIKAIHKLQPPRPTCATCAVDNLCAWDLVSKLDYDLEQADFGCLHHSDYEEVKDE